MASRTPRWRWPWYYHVLWLAYCIAISVLYTWIRPTRRQADIGFCITLALLAAIITTIQVRNRRRCRSAMRSLPGTARRPAAGSA